MKARMTWGPLPWDGTLAELRELLDRLSKAGAPPEAKIVVGLTYGGKQVSARTATTLEA